MWPSMRDVKISMSNKVKVTRASQLELEMEVHAGSKGKGGTIFSFSLYAEDYWWERKTSKEPTGVLLNPRQGLGVGGGCCLGRFPSE